AFQRQLVSLGLPLKEGGDYYGFSLALGSADVSLLSLSNAYRALANGGRHGATSLTVVAKPVLRQMLDPRAAFIVADILSDPLPRARTFGTDSVLTTRFWTAVKTGTSKDMRDNWALGFSQAYTVGVWVGNASGAPMWDVSGTSGAAPIWAAVMNYLHKAQPSRAPQPPAGLKPMLVRFSLGSQDAPLEAARTEWFLQGTQQAVFSTNTETAVAPAERLQGPGRSALRSPGRTRITAPGSGTIIALDPDIPPKRQRVTFAAEGENIRWLMDGKAFANSASAQWAPWPGRHVVQLSGFNGEILDEIRLEVRGAALRRAGSAARSNADPAR
ncbi:MAG: penicillin-binding protein 1C, partial [Rhodoferax sp.]